MSFKSEFSDVYNYLSACCKDSIFTMAYTSEDDFAWKDKDVSTGVIIKYNGKDSLVKIPNGVVEIGSRDDYDDGEYDPNGGHGCFEGCEAITRISLPKSLKKIGKYAFVYCHSLESINLPNSVTSIDYAAFYNCEQLTSINIPDSVKSIGKFAFAGCENLKSINISNGVKSIGLGVFARCEKLALIVIPNSVTSIGEDAFYQCTNLVSINIPNSVTSIGKGAFEESGLTSITCPKDLDLSTAGVPEGCSVIRH